MPKARLLLLLLLLCRPALAVNTERWEVKAPADFQRGKLQLLTLTSDTGIQPGYGVTRLGDFAKEVWSSTVTGDGTIWFGTGSPADVYAIGTNNQPAKIFQTEAVAVTALAADPHGSVFAATLSGGKIFKITPGAKQAGTEFCRLPAPYIWSLVVDKDNALFAATGPDGKIYRITPDGRAEEWYDAEDANIVSLAFDTDGSLFAGSGDRGLLYRVTGKGKAVVLHEFAEDEVKSLVVSGGQLLVGVNKLKARRPRNAGGRQAQAAEFEKLTQRLDSQFGAPPMEDDDNHARETPAAMRSGNALAGALYQRSANGRLDRLSGWENESILHMTVDGAGRVLVAMAGQGRVYRVPDNQHWELLFDLDEQQAGTLAVRAGNLAFIGTGNVGAGYLVDAQLASNGEYTSEVHDAKFLTTWGNLLWQGTGEIPIATRSGNTALPDTTWSAWSDPLRAATAKVSSPNGRFIQVRAQLSRAGNARLQSFTLYSQTQNQKPEVTAIEFGDKPQTAPEKSKADAIAIAAAAAEAKPGATEGEAAIIGVSGALTAKPEEAHPKQATTIKQIRWHASDKDGDALVYRLAYRAEGDDVWLPMSRDKQPLRKSECSWDTESVPDGWYRVKVVASDEEANPAGEALRDEKLSDPLRVNNRRPDVLQLAFDSASSTLTGRVHANLGLIRLLEFALDGGEWTLFAPLDGVLDDRDEAFALRLTLDPGAHTLAVRATDEDGNVGIEKTLIRRK
ncbi:MAG: hypothetical protein WCR06_05365 [bacterium]